MINSFNFLRCNSCGQPERPKCSSCQEEQPVHECCCNKCNKCNKCACGEPDIILGTEACCKPCWDTCKCMDEIIKLQEGCAEVHTELNNIDGRFTRDEKTIQDNYNYLSKLIGDLAEKEEQDIQNERNRATGEESRIEDKLDNYIDSNDAALAAEIARATAAENNLQGQINGLNDGLTEEIAARIAGDNTERDRATTAENNLATALANETSDRQSADTLLQQNINNENAGRIEEDLAIRQLIGQVDASLVNYYTKGDTYNRSEIQQILSNIRQFQYKIAPSLPTAGADTIGYIYLIPSPNQVNQNVRDEYITLATTVDNVTTYTWEQIGTTTVDLSGYSTTAQMNAAIQSAIANKADRATTLAGYGITDAGISNGTIFIGGNSITPLTVHQDISGKANRTEVVTSVVQSGNSIVVTNGNGTTNTIILPTDQSSQVTNINAQLTGILNRLTALEGLWTDNGSTLTAKSGRSVTGAGFYDSTI